MTRKHLIHAATAAAFSLAAVSAFAGGEFIHAVSKTVNPHGLSVPSATVKVAGPATAARIHSRNELLNQGLYALAILEADGNWEAAAYLSAEIREYVAGHEPDATSPGPGAIQLPEHAQPVVYPTQLVKELPLSDELKAAVTICLIKAPSWSASTDPTIREIGKEFARQCAVDRG
jgi:hypothetical protein